MLLAKRTEDFIPTLFNEFLDWNWNNGMQVSSTPQMNIMETADNYKLELSVPGLSKEDLNLCIDADDTLIVQMVKKTNEKKDENKRYLRHEFTIAEFRQTMTLPDDICKDNIEAKVENGILEIVLPKMKQEDKKRITHTINIK